MAGRTKSPSIKRLRLVYLRPVRRRLHLDDTIVGWHAVDETGRVLAQGLSADEVKAAFEPNTRFIDVEGLLSD